MKIQTLLVTACYQPAHRRASEAWQQVAPPGPGPRPSADVSRQSSPSTMARQRGEKLLLMQIRHYRALYDSRDSAACVSAFEAYRHNGVAVTADLLVYHNAMHAEEIPSDTRRMRLVRAAIRRKWESLLKLADLVLLDANLLADIANTQRIRAVVADGRRYRGASPDRLLAEVAALNQQVEKHGRDQ
jgi:hypothetical protein